MGLGSLQFVVVIGGDFFTPGFEVCSLLKRGNRFVRKCWQSCLLEGNRGQEGSTLTPSRALEAASPLGRAVISEVVGWGMHQNMCGAGFAFLRTEILRCPIPFLPASLAVMELLVPPPKLKTVPGPLFPTWDPSVCRGMWPDGL